MTDIIQELRTKWRHWQDKPTVELRAADLIEQLRAELDALKAAPVPQPLDPSVLRGSEYHYASGWNDCLAMMRQEIHAAKEEK